MSETSHEGATFLSRWGGGGKRQNNTERGKMDRTTIHRRGLTWGASSAMVLAQSELGRVRHESAQKGLFSLKWGGSSGCRVGWPSHPSHLLKHG